MSEPENHTAADDRWYRREISARAELRGYIAGQMGKGAFYAACVFFGVLFFIGFLRLVARFLPEDPYAAMDAAERTMRLFA